MLRKRLTLLRKPQDLSFVEFDRHWRSGHATIVAALPGIREYVQNPVEAAWSIDTSSSLVHGVVEVWFDDSRLSDPRQHSSSAQQADEPRFIAALTGYTVRPCDSYEAEAKVWVFTTGALDTEHLVPPDEARRGAIWAAFEPEDSPLMHRPLLSREETASRGVVFPCSTSAIGEDLFSRVVKHCGTADDPSVRVLLTRTRRIL